MKTNGFRVILLLVLFPTFFLSSCVMDSKPLGYSVKNCTKDGSPVKVCGLGIDLH